MLGVCQCDTGYTGTHCEKGCSIYVCICEQLHAVKYDASSVHEALAITTWNLYGLARNIYMILLFYCRLVLAKRHRNL